MNTTYYKSNLRPHIAVCGDSFSVGIGCRNLASEPYGSILAKTLNKRLINLAKGSSTNLSIFLQVKYVVEKFKDSTDLVLVSTTSYDRTNWFPFDFDEHIVELSNEHVNYHQYPPYGKATNGVILPNPMGENHRGVMFTDNYRGIIDYWETFGQKNLESDYYARFKNEPKERMKLLYDVAISIHDERIDKLMSAGSMTMAHQLLKKAQINHLILTEDPQFYAKYIDETNLVRVSWGELSVKYPDDIPTMHTSSEGHRVAFDLVMTKLRENKWYA